MREAQKPPSPTPLSDEQRKISQVVNDSTPTQKPTQPGYSPDQNIEDYADELYRQADEINPELKQLTEEMAALTKGEAGFRDRQHTEHRYCADKGPLYKAGEEWI